MANIPILPRQILTSPEAIKSTAVAEFGTQIAEQQQDIVGSQATLQRAQDKASIASDVVQTVGKLGVDFLQNFSVARNQTNFNRAMLGLEKRLNDFQLELQTRPDYANYEGDFDKVFSDLKPALKEQFNMSSDVQSEFDLRYDQIIEQANFGLRQDVLSRAQRDLLSDGSVAIEEAIANGNMGMVNAELSNLLGTNVITRPDAEAIQKSSGNRIFRKQALNDARALAATDGYETAIETVQKFDNEGKDPTYQFLDNNDRNDLVEQLKSEWDVVRKQEFDAATKLQGENDFNLKTQLFDYKLTREQIQSAYDSGIHGYNGLSNSQYVTALDGLKKQNEKLQQDREINATLEGNNIMFSYAEEGYFAEWDTVEEQLTTELVDIPEENIQQFRATYLTNQANANAQRTEIKNQSSRRELDITIATDGIDLDIDRSRELIEGLPTDEQADYVKQIDKVENDYNHRIFKLDADIWADAGQMETWENNNQENNLTENEIIQLRERSRKAAEGDEDVSKELLMTTIRRNIESGAIIDKNQLPDIQKALDEAYGGTAPVQLDNPEQIESGDWDKIYGWLADSADAREDKRQEIIVSNASSQFNFAESLLDNYREDLPSLYSLRNTLEGAAGAYTDEKNGITSETDNPFVDLYESSVDPKIDSNRYDSMMVRIRNLIKQKEEEEEAEAKQRQSGAWKSDIATVQQGWLNVHNNTTDQDWFRSGWADEKFRAGLLNVSDYKALWNESQDMQEGEIQPYIRDYATRLSDYMDKSINEIWKKADESNKSKSWINKNLEIMYPLSISAANEYIEYVMGENPTGKVLDQEGAAAYFATAFGNLQQQAGELIFKDTVNDFIDLGTKAITESPIKFVRKTGEIITQSLTGLKDFVESKNNEFLTVDYNQLATGQIEESIFNVPGSVVFFENAGESGVDDFAYTYNPNVEPGVSPFVPVYEKVNGSWVVYDPNRETSSSQGITAAEQLKQGVTRGL